MGKIDPVIQSMVDYGIALTILGIVVLFLIAYFRRLISQKTYVEKLMEKHAAELRKIRDDVVVIKAILQGGFRTKGLDDE